jgi:hypothetical protein
MMHGVVQLRRRCPIGNYGRLREFSTECEIAI